MEEWRRKRVCMIGTSYIGALMTAYRNRQPPADFEFAFLGCYEDALRDIVIRDGRLWNVPYISTAASLEIGAYEGFIIYGDMDPPHQLVRQEQYLVRERFSDEVRLAALTDLVRATGTFQLREALRANTAAPIYFLTHNIPLSVVPLELESLYARGVHLLSTLAGLDRYIEFPRALFDDQFVPRRRYHSGSLDLTGERSDEINSSHDEVHLNESGGKLVLDHVLGRLGIDDFRTGWAR